MKTNDLNYSNTFLRSLVPSSWATIEVTNTTKGDALHEQRYVLVCTVRPMTGLTIVPSVNWYYNGSIVEISERVTVDTRYSYSNSVTTHTLTFLPVFHDDGGMYSCQTQIAVPWMTTQPPVKQASVNMPVISN
jgi:hypothetical protein